MGEQHNETFFSTLLDFHTRGTMALLLKRIAWFGLYTLVLLIVEAKYHWIPLRSDIIFASLMGTMLSLLLVFRTNTAYDRFWEGRKAWGSLVIHTRIFATMLHAMLPRADKENRTFFAQHISAYTFATKNHLRDSFLPEELSDLESASVERLQSAQHVPNAIGKAIFERMQMLFRSGIFRGEDMRNMKPQYDVLLDTTGVCERIKFTPIPPSYGTYIRVFIFVYLVILPFLLIEKYELYTIPAEMFAGYILMGLEMIAEEIEEPFGLDANDLPLDSISRTIQANVFEILEV